MGKHSRSKGASARYISFGAGVQSTALLLCSDRGLHDVPRADFAIFADTIVEPKWVYDTIKRVRGEVSIPIHVVAKGNLLQDAIDRHNGTRSRFANIPMFTEGDDGREAMLRRQCTREYKITVIEKEVRRLLGYKPRQRIPKGSAVAMIGISLDEVVRMKPNRTPWVENTWPLVDARLRREDCLRIVKEQIGFEPKRSACVFCPYHSDSYWRELKTDHPDEWEAACRADEALRNQTASGLRRPAFVHRSLKPLREAPLNEEQSAFEWDSFSADCEGMCGV